MKAINTIQRHSLGKLRPLLSTTAAISTKSIPKLSLVQLILKSKIPDEEKALLLEMEIKKEALEKELNNEKEKNQLLLDLSNEKINTLAKEKEQETVYKLHYQQLLTVRAVIENYEKNFGDKLRTKNISRMDKWTIFQALTKNSNPSRKLASELSKSATLSILSSRPTRQKFIPSRWLKVWC